MCQKSVTWLSMNKESCLLYAGLSFRLEWYFDEMGYSQPYEYFKELSTDKLPLQEKQRALIIKKKYEEREMN